jgi:hypothetical protein
MTHMTSWKNLLDSPDGFSVKKTRASVNLWRDVIDKSVQRPQENALLRKKAIAASVCLLSS